MTDVIRADLDYPDHCHAILRLLNAYACDPMGGNAPMAAEVQERLIPGLKAHPTSQVYLAKSENEFIGIAVCFTGFSTFAAKPLINIHDLAVLPAHRGKGVGRQLLRAVEETARSTDCCKLTLEVRKDNPGAAGLYHSEGYGGATTNDGTIQYLFLEKRLY